ncbi:MAG: hypothetical protein ACKOHK_15270, partial [Planctomycetia bacterium]
MPKKKNICGIRAATGMLRPKIVSGARNARNSAKQAANTPERHADGGRQSETEHHALERHGGFGGEPP